MEYFKILVVSEASLDVEISKSFALGLFFQRMHLS